MNENGVTHQKTVPKPGKDSEIKTGKTTIDYISSTFPETNQVKMYDPKDLGNESINDYEARGFLGEGNKLTLDDITNNLEPNDVRRRYRLEVLQTRTSQLNNEHDTHSNKLSFLVVPPDEFDSLIDSRHPYFHPLQPESTLPDYAYDPKGILRLYHSEVYSVELALNKDEETAHLTGILRKTQKDPGDVYNWLLLVLFMATQIPHPADPKITPKIFGQPGRLALKRAAHMLIGDRGAVHGWSTFVPNIDLVIKISIHKTLIIPFRWAPHPNTDGDSEFDSDSSGHGVDTDGSGPRGVKHNYPAVTGLTSDSETSSFLTDDEKPIRRMDVFGGLSSDNFQEYKLMKRFDTYLAEHNRERRYRRSARAARRWIRKKYNKEDRLKLPIFNLEAKRAEALAAEKVRRDIKNVERNYAEKRAADRLERKERRNLYRKNHSTHGHNFLHPTDTDLAYSRIQKFRSELCEQVKSTWSQYYGNRSKTITDSFSQKDNGFKLECFMTPVRWIQQQGPNCGLAVLAMAARPILACEVAVGGGVGGGGLTNDGTDEKDDKIKDAIKTYRNQALSKIKSCPTYFNPPTLLNLQQQAIMKGISGRGEMFSASALAGLAQEHQRGRYKVCVLQELPNCEKKKILLQQKNNITKKSNSEDNFANVDVVSQTQNTDINHVLESKKNNDCLSKTERNNGSTITSTSSQTHPDDNFQISSDKEKSFYPSEVSSNIKLSKEQTSHSGLSIWQENVIQRLINGYLIAICFDCDKNMMPCSKNGGRTAHWGLLCGVIYERPYNKPKRSLGQLVPRVSSDVGYCYSYNQFSERFEPEGYVLRQELLEMVEDSVSQLIKDCPIDNNRLNVKKLNKLLNDVLENRAAYKTQIERSNYKLCPDEIRKLDPNRVWVVARHGKKGGRYDVWSLKELESSNKQLHTPADEILRTIPPEKLSAWEQNSTQSPLEEKNYFSILNENSVSDLTQKFKQESESMEKKEQEHRNFEKCSSLLNSITDIQTFMQENVIEADTMENIWSWLSAVNSAKSVPVERILPRDILIKTESGLETEKLKTEALETEKSKTEALETEALETKVLETDELELKESNGIDGPIYLNKKKSRISSLPPPPPLPLPIKYPVPLITLKPKENPPFVLPEGPRLDQCLANRFVAFKPESDPLIVSENEIEYSLRDHMKSGMLNSLLCHFTFTEKLGL